MEEDGLRLSLFFVFKSFLVVLRPPDGLNKDKFYLSFDGALQNAVIARL